MRNFETRHVHKNGRIVPLSWSGVWSEPEQKHFLFGRDMTERKSAEEQLRRLAHFDQLTGLPNRVSLHKDLDTILRERAGNPALPINVATLDLDAFKDVNARLSLFASFLNCSGREGAILVVDDEHEVTSDTSHFEQMEGGLATIV